MSDLTLKDTQKRPRFGLRTAWLALVVFAICAIFVFRGVGRWLVVEDPLEHSGAIVVLSGGLPYRAVEAAKIYTEGMAPQIWLTRPQHPAALEKFGVEYEGEEVYNRKILLHEGVPDSAIRVLDPGITNTVDEERAVFDEMHRAAISRVIIVTSPPHTRRTRTLWRKLAPRDLHSIVRPASTDPFDPAHWWRNTQDALDVTREILGLMNAWAGLPIKPAAR